MGHQFFLTAIDVGLCCMPKPSQMSILVYHLLMLPLNTLNELITDSIFPNFTTYLYQHFISTILTFWIHCVIIDQHYAPWVIVIQSLFCKSCWKALRRQVSTTPLQLFNFVLGIFKMFFFKKDWNYFGYKFRPDTNRGFGVDHFEVPISFFEPVGWVRELLLIYSLNLHSSRL